MMVSQKVRGFFGLASLLLLVGLSVYVWRAGLPKWLILLFLLMVDWRDFSAGVSTSITGWFIGLFMRDRDG